MTFTILKKNAFIYNRKDSFFEKLLIYFFSLFPIAFLLGNAAININIIIIDLSFLIICLYQKKWSWLKDKYFIFIFVIWIYLLVNAITVNIADETLNKIKDFSRTDSLIRSLGFVKYIFLIFAVEHLFLNNKKSINQIFYFWSIIIVVVLIDVVFEKIFGFNTLGYKSPNPDRIVSFFKDEMIVGGFLLGFSFVTASFLLKNSDKSTIKKLFSNLFLILSLICIYITTERSNFIKSIILFSCFLFFVSNHYLLFKKKYILFLLIVAILISSLIFKNTYYNYHTTFLRFEKSFKNLSTNPDLYKSSGDISGKSKPFFERFNALVYASHYHSAWEIFKDYPIFGIGNKNFRLICKDNKYENINLFNKRCFTHPHQIHYELLAENGIVGYLLIIFFIIYALINSTKVYFRTYDITLLITSLFVLTHMLPFLPSGSFFATGNVTFWINFAILKVFLNKTNY